jgi:hypothetical protein
LNPSLKMEDLTKADIEMYIEGRLGKNLAMQDLRRLEPESVVKLMGEIGERAKGVFLWVVFVVEQLLVTVRDSPRLPAIWKPSTPCPLVWKNYMTQYKAQSTLLNGKWRPSCINWLWSGSGLGAVKSRPPFFSLP